MLRTMHLMASAAAVALAADDGSAGAASSLKQVTISGFQFEIDAPYSEGHQLNVAEASVLNQTYLENIRNNVAGKIKAAKEAHVKAGGTEDSFSIDTPIGGEGEDATKTLRQIAQEYASTYEFGIRTSRNVEPADPTEREARVIARETLNAHLKKAGTKRKDVDDTAYENALDTLSKRDDIVKEAQRRVKVKSGIGSSEVSLDDLLAGSGTTDDTGEGEDPGAEA